MAAPSSTFLATSGDGYEQVMGRWSRRLAGPFLDFAGSGTGETVLDAGCGTGSLAFELARRGTADAIHAVDIAEAYVAHAAARSTEGKIRFAVGDICDLPFAENSFDRVLSLLVLHFVPAADKAVAEMRRVARPGATVAAAVWDARGGFVANRLFWDTAAALDAGGNARRARNYTRPMTRPGELRAAWEKAGLADVRTAELLIRMEFASFEDFWTPYIGKDGPGADYVGTLSPEGVGALREAVRNAYLDGEADGPRAYAAIAWAVAGIA